MMNGSYGFMGGFMWFFWIALIVGLFFFVRWMVRQSRPAEQKHGESSLEILKRRYAHGEIGKKEFELKKKDILS
ncbi:MAG: SHOCT domain-containing protein [Candidatus Aminicenantes bacterium]|jgi:putative membrane protein|nr:SHOCT domain-containing protein [Candidatus Aminicenantes bacterium]